MQHIVLIPVKSSYPGTAAVPEIMILFVVSYVDETKLLNICTYYLRLN